MVLSLSTSPYDALSLRTLCMLTCMLAELVPPEAPIRD